MKRAAVLLLVLLPVLWTATYIHRYAIDGWHSDQWSQMLPFVAQDLEGKLRLQDFQGQHQEHRILFPRIFMLYLSRLTHWDTRVEIWLQIPAALLVVFNLEMIRRRAGGSVWLIPVAAAWLISPQAWEVWMQGFMLHFWAPLICLTGILWLGYCRMGALWCVLLSFVAMYSHAGGLFCWPIALLVLWHARQKLDDIIATAVFGLILGVVYFWGFQPERQNQYATALHHPIQAAQYFLGYLGNGFAFGTAFSPSKTSVVVGGVFFLIFLLALCDRESRSFPWVCLALFTLCLAAASTGSRMLQSPLQSRYVIFSVLFPIAVFFIFSQWTNVRNVVAVLMLLHIAGSVASEGGWQSKRAYAVTGRQLVSLANVSPEPQLRDAIVNSIIAILPDREAVIPQIRLLNRHGYLRPALFEPNDDATTIQQKQEQLPK